MLLNHQLVRALLQEDSQKQDHWKQPGQADAVFTSANSLPNTCHESATYQALCWDSEYKMGDMLMGQ